MKLLAKIIIIIAVFFCGFYFGQKQVLSPNEMLEFTAKPLEIEEGNVPNQVVLSEISAALVIDFSNGQIEEYGKVNLPLRSSVFDLLKKAAAENEIELRFKSYGEMGIFIESIGGVENDFAGDRFWQYWVNGEYAKIGAGSYQLKDGDIVEWKLIKGQINI
jgi:hypothetical protein